MGTVAVGSTESVRCPLDGTITVTPTIKARVAIVSVEPNFSNAVISAAKTFDVSAGDVVNITAIDGSVTYTEPAFSSSQVEAIDYGIRRVQRLAILGDSRSASYNGQTVAGVTSKKASGAAVWATKLADCPRAYQASLNFAADGATWADVLASQVPQFVASAATIGVVHCGLNDVFTTTRTFSDIIADITAVNDASAAAGRVLINCIDAPRNSAASDSTALRQLSMKVNNWHRKYCRDNAIPFVDFNSACVGTDGTYTVPSSAGWMQDNSHPGPRMAYAQGVELAAVLSTMIPPDPSVAPFDIYDASNNPGGNLITSPWMTGTSGTKSGSPAPTGNVATGFTASTASMSGAGSVAASKESITLGNGHTYDKQVLTFANASGDGGASEEIRLIYNVIGSGALTRAANGIDPGDTIQLGVMVEITAHANCEALALRAVDNNGTTSVEQIDMARASGYKMPAAPVAPMLLVTEPFVVGAYSGGGNQSISLRLTAYMDSNNGGGDPSSLTMKAWWPFIRNLSRAAE